MAGAYQLSNFLTEAPRPRRSPQAERVNSYGLDLYSLFTSIEVVLTYLAKIDPEAARRARDRYACFEDFAEDTQAYGYAATFGLTESCEIEVVSQLVELQRRAAEYARRDGRVAMGDRAARGTARADPS